MNNMMARPLMKIVMIGDYGPVIVLRGRFHGQWGLYENEGGGIGANGVARIRLLNADAKGNTLVEVRHEHLGRPIGDWGT